MSYWVWGSEYLRIIIACCWMAFHKGCSIYIPTNTVCDSFIFVSITSFYFLLIRSVRIRCFIVLSVCLWWFMCVLASHAGCCAGTLLVLPLVFSILCTVIGLSYLRHFIVISLLRSFSFSVVAYSVKNEAPQLLPPQASRNSDPLSPCSLLSLFLSGAVLTPGWFYRGVVSSPSLPMNSWKT